MSARGLNPNGDSPTNPDVTGVQTPASPLLTPTGGASAFWLTVGAGTVPTHLSLDKDADPESPDAPDLVTREVELANPDLLRLFKQP